MRARQRRRRRGRRTRRGPRRRAAPRHTSSAATIGEPPGTVGTERTPHRGWYLSTYERTKTEGERAALAARARSARTWCASTRPRSRARARRRHRAVPARVPRRPPEGLRRRPREPRRHRRLRRGHLLAAEHGVAGERYLLNGMTLDHHRGARARGRGRRRPAQPRLLPRRVATVAAAVVERGFRLAGRRPPVCREMVRTLLHGHRYDGSRAERELGLRYTDPRETLAQDGRVGEGRGTHSLERLKGGWSPLRLTCARTWRAGSTRSRWKPRRRWQ